MDSAAAALQNNEATSAVSFVKLNGSFATLMGNLQDADVAPLPRTAEAVAQAVKNLQALEGEWKTLQLKK